MRLSCSLQRVPVTGLMVTGLMAFLALSSSMGYALDTNKAGSPTAELRILQGVDETKLVQLKGSTHPLAQARFDRGAVPDSFPLEHMYLQLKRSPEQESALQNHLRELQDKNSGKYHQWLSAEELGRQYGPAQRDIDAVVEWLGSHGLKVNTVHKSGVTIDVSGTAGQVKETFHTEIHRFNVKGEQHIANVGEAKIPAALAPVVMGMVSLHDFLPKAMVAKPKKNFSTPCNGCPDGFDGIEQYDEGPADFATIYNVAPLYKGHYAVTGKGQTVTVLEVTDVNPADVATFRKAFGLSTYSGKFAQIHPGPGCYDPGVNGAEGEAALDSEWAGAIAPDATVHLASCANTQTNFGAFIAAQNLLDEAVPAPIMSLSYGGCEAFQGPGENAYIGSLWLQAAIEGVSVFVSTGDTGSALCDDGEPYSVDGIAANGLATTPYNFAAGGTDFLDTAKGTTSNYWTDSNGPGGKSAKSYIPEMTWNDSCASGVLFRYYGYGDGVSFCNSFYGQFFLDTVGGSGAPSFVYSKPYWQKGIVGIPSDGHRDIPDVSLFASNAFWNHAVLFCMSDPNEGGVPCDYTNGTDTLFNSAGGTSFTAPQFASIQALLNQKAGAPQGNPAPIYYDLTRTEYGSATDPNKTRLSQCSSNMGSSVGSSCVFRDVTTGNNSVPCYGTNDCYAPGVDTGSYQRQTPSMRRHMWREPGGILRPAWAR